MARSKGRTGRPWQRIRRQVIDRATHCGLCGCWLDKTKRWPHPAAPTVDHIVSLCEGGHPTDVSNLVAVCFTCNLKKEQQRRRGRGLGGSRDW